MPDISRFLPMMPWEGPPLPRGMKKEWPKTTAEGEIKLPSVKLPEKLPFEDTVNKGINKVVHAVNNFPPIRAINAIGARIPYPGEVRVGTPLGSIKIPPLNLPRLELPELDERHMQAMKAAVGQDLSYLPGLIPGVGDVIADMVEDTFGAKIHETLTPDEYEDFKRWDKKSPSTTIAMAQTLVRRKGK